ncbi:hypothetical protein KEM52_002924 [Ascosphaera acerosa]|nr:hypothetical protein KEM52_002924 [Ascosphaera acerosa]
MLATFASAAYVNAASASSVALYIDPRVRPGWKYTVSVATVCFVSCPSPIHHATGAMKVASDPSRYARLHFSTARPVSLARAARRCSCAACAWRRQVLRRRVRSEGGVAREEAAEEPSSREAAWWLSEW